MKKKETHKKTEREFVRFIFYFFFLPLLSFFLIVFLKHIFLVFLFYVSTIRWTFFVFVSNEKTRKHRHIVFLFFRNDTNEKERKNKKEKRNSSAG